jgi:hypothetical protein
MIDCGYGGSAVCERDVDPSTPTNYWVNMTNPVAPADGPLLTSALAILATKNGDSSQPAYSFGLIDHGIQSATFVDSPNYPNASFTKAMYKTATQYMITRLRAGAGNSTLKCAYRMIGRREQVTTSIQEKMQVIRDAQQEILAADANLFAGAETYDFPSRDAVHPDDWGYNLIGQREADEVAKVVYSITGTVAHPAINSATYSSATNSIDVVIRTGSQNDRLFLVPDPCNFYVLNSSGVQVPILKAFWTVASTGLPSYAEYTLRLHLTGSATGGTLYHLWGYGPNFDPQRSIRTTYQTGFKPLRTAKIAL